MAPLVVRRAGSPVGRTLAATSRFPQRSGQICTKASVETHSAVEGDDLDDAGAARKASRIDGSTTDVGAISITASPGRSERPTSMSAMLMPALPSSVPTVPITPGRSSLVIITMWSTGGTSNVCPSTNTMRCSLRLQCNVPDRCAHRRGR